MNVPTIRDLRVVPLSHEFGVSNSEVGFRFARTGRVFHGTPLLIGGKWRPNQAAKLARLGVLAQFKFDGDWNDVQADDLERMVMRVDDQRDHENLATLMDTDLAPRYVRVNSVEVAAVQERWPGLTVIGGNFLTAPAANASTADMKVLGTDADQDEIETVFGVRLDPSMLMQAAGCKVASFGCVDPGDVIKCFAMGAQFVEVTSSLTMPVVEQLLGVVSGAVFLLGARHPHDLPETTAVRPAK